MKSNRTFSNKGGTERYGRASDIRGLSVARRRVLNIWFAIAVGLTVGPRAGTLAGPAKVRRQYVAGRFGHVHLHCAGKVREGGRAPLICMHMSPFSALIYEPLLSIMGADRFAVAVDTPGFGLSDPTPSQPSIVDYANAMGDVIDVLGLGQVDVMGYHTGSETCIELARQRPKQIRRIVMVSAPHWTEEERVSRLNSAQAPEIHEDGSHLTEWWQESVYWSMEGRTLDMLARVFPARVRNPHIMHWGHRAAYGYSLQEMLPEVDKPILVLNPEDDLWDRTPLIRPYLRHSASRIQDLPGWNHGFLDVKTVETAELLKAFLDGPLGL